MSTTFWDQDDPQHELNVTNVNARSILIALGMGDEELDGSIPAPLLVEKCDIALGIIQMMPQLDAEIPIQEDRMGENGVRWVDCGRADHYLHHRLTTLRSIAVGAGFGIILWA